MTALRYQEAQERSRLLDVHGYRIELDLTGGADTFGSVTVIRFGCRAPGSASFAELRPARLRRAVLNGQEVDPAALTGNRLPLAGYVPRYFTALAGAAAGAGRVWCRHGFPQHAVDAATVRAGER